MKKITSLLLCMMMVLSLIVIPAGATEKVAKVFGDDILFAADFDVVTPQIAATDQSNTAISSSDDGDAFLIQSGSADGKYGAYFATETFTYGTDATTIAFDINRESAGYHFQGALWDSAGSVRNFCIDVGNTTADTWYSYVIDLSSLSGENYTRAWRKAYGAGTWETATVVSKEDATAPAKTNTLKLGSGSGSSNYNGTWHVDNIAVTKDVPAISVLMPADPTTTTTKQVYENKFEGTAHNMGSAPSITSLTASDGGRTVFELDATKSSDFTGVRTTSFYTKVFDLPSAEEGYTVSFDFKRVTAGNANDALWIQTYHDGDDADTAFDGNCNKAIASIALNQFTVGEWYRISYTVKSTGTATAFPKFSGTATLLKDNTSSTLSIGGVTSWGSRCNVIMMALYNATGGAWRDTKVQFDNMTCTKEQGQPVKTTLLSEATTGNVLPLLTAYDENGVLMHVEEGESGTLGAGGYKTDAYNVKAKYTTLCDADQVKALYLSDYDTIKPYADAVSFGDAFSTANGAPCQTVGSLELTADMFPQNGTKNFTVMAYTTHFAATKDNIPAYDPEACDLLVLDQKLTAPDAVKYDASLYDGATEDLVVVINAEDATSPKITLLEENQAPAITNVSMHLGSDPSQRNFTWFSLKSDAGKIKYAKTKDFVNGGFPDDAAVVTASRDHDNSRYSLKNYYYNNKAIITGLAPNTTYAYQLLNGTDKSEIYTFTTGGTGSFSFAFGGDAQVGGSDYVGLDKETVTWQRTLNQMMNEEEFEGIDFFMSAGDQVDSVDHFESSNIYNDYDAYDEELYDLYLNNDVFKSVPQAVVLGNHDIKTQGRHHQHFYQPNMDENYGASYYKQSGEPSYLMSADYYFVYNSVLFIVLNTNTFTDKTGTEAARAADKLAAEQHLEFIDNVLEATKDNKDILWRIVMYHQSPYGSSYHGNYTYNAAGTNFARTEQYTYINMREYLIPGLYERDVDLVLSGHDHCYTRTHIIKPNKDSNGNYIDESVITPYAGGYTYADGTTTPTYVNWTDKLGVTYTDLKVSSKPVKVVNPDGILHVTGATSSGSQVNGVEHVNHYAAETLTAATRHLSRIDITSNSLTLNTYNLGKNGTEEVSLVDTFTIEKTRTVSVADVSLSESAATIPVGQTKSLSHKLSPVEPTNANVSWSSDNPAVATVSAEGVVTAVSQGVANITVTAADGGHSASCAVTVTAAVPVTSVSVSPKTLTMGVAETITLAATVAPEGATTKDVIWSSSDETIATVSENGSVTAHKHGDVTITATSKEGAKSDSCAVTVFYVPATSRTISQTALSLVVTKTAQLSATIEPANASYKNVTWSSSDFTVAAVDETGLVTGVKKGTATISATTEEGTLTCQVTVIGGDLFCQDFEDASHTALSGDVKGWSIQTVNGNKVLDMNAADLTTSERIGTVYTTYMRTYDGSILMPASGYVLDFDIKQVSAGGLNSVNIMAYTSASVCNVYAVDTGTFEKDVWYDIKIVQTPSGFTGYYKKSTEGTWVQSSSVIRKGYQYSSINVAYNSLDIAPYLAAGQSRPSIEEAQKTHFQFDNIRTYVDEPVTSIALSQTSATLTINQTLQLGCTLAPLSATDRHIGYSSSDTDVATVDETGKVTAVGGGTAYITARAAGTGLTATCTVTVPAPPVVVTIEKTDSGDNWIVTVTTEYVTGADLIYLGAYTYHDKLVYATKADFDKSGNSFTIPKISDVKYFTVYIWNDELQPCTLPETLTIRLSE